MTDAAQPKGEEGMGRAVCIDKAAPFGSLHRKFRSVSS